MERLLRRLGRVGRGATGDFGAVKWIGGIGGMVRVVGEERLADGMTARGNRVGVRGCFI